MKKRAAILVSSDSSYRGEREDKSGPAIQEIVEAAGYEVISYKILPDEQEMLSDWMRQIADEEKAELILTTGGTGFAKRDCMPEATMQIAQKLVPGIPEAMRAYSARFTKRAMLSRAVCVIRNHTLIVNLPGSPKAVTECLEYVMSELDHGIEILTGEASNCARK